MNEPQLNNIFVVCANLFIQKGDKYLVIKRRTDAPFAPGVIMPPGGRVEPGEDPLAAAKREALEETGLTAANIRLRGVLAEHTPNRDTAKSWLIFYFLGDFQSGELKRTEEGELMWLTAQELAGAKLFPTLENTLDKILDTEAEPVFASFTLNRENTDIIDG